MRLTAPRHPAMGALALVGIIGALAWFTLPVLTATYNEGFQATIVMNAHAVLDRGASGSLGGIDPLHGLNDDFMLMSRFGVSLLLAGLLKLGVPAAAGFRAVMLCSLVVLVGANAALLAWRYRMHPLLACVPALLFPGLFESAWFFNDNVLSAALSSTALLVFWTRTSLAATAGAALLLGLAVACRTDAILVAPALAVIAWWTRPGWGTLLRHALVAAPVAAAVPVLIYGAFGLDVLDILHLTRRAAELWARSDPWGRVLLPAVKGFSAPGLLAVGIGAVAVLWRRMWLEALLCLAVPLLYAAAYGRMLTEVRYLLPLAPMFGILAVEGWRAVLRAGRPARLLAGVAFAGAAAACLVPPSLPAWPAVRFMAADHDMTRPLLGRFWSPVLGMWWNRTLDAGATALDDAIGAGTVPGGTLLVVSTYWTPDRMVDLLLRTRGFTLSQSSAPPPCRRIADVFTRQGAVVVHMRPHIPMVPTERTGVAWQQLGLPCLQALGRAEQTPVLIAGWMELMAPPAGLASAGVTVLHVPVPDAVASARFIAERRYGYYVAAASAALVPAFLAGAADAADLKGAQAAIDDPRAW